ncbi:histidine kinase [Erwinia sp. AnSW2-5]|uniref:histidine kinase n=1 Tax=Erwinia sp. AnSW2-5 TaxID=3367692 RepID=UPI003869DD87
MPLTRPLTSSRLACALFAIVVLYVISSGLTLLTLSGSLRDAEVVNLAGSLRMQVWRMNGDVTTHSPLYAQHITDYQRTLHSPALRALDRFYVPATVRQRYRELLMATQPTASQTGENPDQVIRQVAQIDQLVLALQHWAERKMRLAALICLLGFLTIALLVFIILHRIRHRVVGPFKPGVLARALTRMSGEWQTSWRAMSLNIEEKNAALTRDNRRLSLLYACSQQLSHSVKGREAFLQTLRRVSDHEKLSFIAFSTPELGSLSVGCILPDRQWQTLPLRQHPEQPTWGELRWQADHHASPVMDSVASLLAHALEQWQAQQQVQSQLLLQERATIARELHDSLAQSLTFLRIQLVRLKRATAADASARQAIVEEFEQVLSTANRQLRELLTTFRLTIEPASLTHALEQVIAPLRPQSTATITLACPLDVQLPAQQHIHVLQMVREALLNAVRHAHATEICISGDHHPVAGMTITINDNGVGMATLEEPEGHYGLNIMHERAALLNGELTITRHANGGTCVSLHFIPLTENRPEKELLSWKSKKTSVS